MPAEEFVHPLDMMQARESAKLPQTAMPDSLGAPEVLSPLLPPSLASPEIPPPPPGEVREPAPAATPAPDPEPPPSTTTPPTVEPPAPVTAEPAPAVLETAPPKAEEKTPIERQPSWRELNEARKLAKETQEELNRERLRAQQLEQERLEWRRLVEQAQQPPQSEGVSGEPSTLDPVSVMEQRLAQIEAAQRRQEMDARLTNEARAFAQQKPDYEAALNYYVENEKKVAEASGELQSTAGKVMQLAPGEVRRIAMQQGMTEAEAARQLATAVIYEQRRQQIVEGCFAAGRSVPEAIYEMANLRGFHAPTSPESAPPPVVPANMSAAQQIREEQTTSASQSLSNLPNHSSSPPMRIRTRAEFQALTPKAQESYMLRMDKEQPGWERELG